MIEVLNEKKSALKARDINDVISFALQDSTNDGFVNAYVFERALYVYSYLILSNDKDVSDKVRSTISNDGILEAWDYLLKNGEIEKMYDSCKEDLALIEDSADIVFNDYKEYAKSTRSALDSMQILNNDIMQQAMSNMSSIVNSDEYKNIMDIANKWGLSPEA